MDGNTRLVLSALLASHIRSRNCFCFFGSWGSGLLPYSEHASFDSTRKVKICQILQARDSFSFWSWKFFLSQKVFYWDSVCKERDSSSGVTETIQNTPKVTWMKTYQWTKWCVLETQQIQVRKDGWEYLKQHINSLCQDQPQYQHACDFLHFFFVKSAISYGSIFFATVGEREDQEFL